jgi:hypothetical protein
LFFLIVVEQVSHTAELFGGTLQSFNLFAQLRLFRLFLMKYFVDIPHNVCLLIAL